MRLLAFAGSARSASFNKRLAQAVAAHARAAGADVEWIDLADLPMPLYDGDLEAADGIPEHAARLRQAMAQSAGYFIACPEYNSSITPLLKNTLDWVSRPAQGVPPLVAFQGKVVGLVATSPGALGGLRGLVHVRSILSSVGALVVPGEVAVPKGHEAFGEDGALVDPGVDGRVAALAARVVETAAKLGA